MTTTLHQQQDGIDGTTPETAAAAAAGDPIRLELRGVWGGLLYVVVETTTRGDGRHRLLSIYPQFHKKHFAMAPPKSSDIVALPTSATTSVDVAPSPADASAGAGHVPDESAKGMHQPYVVLLSIEEMSFLLDDAADAMGATLGAGDAAAVREHMAARRQASPSIDLLCRAYAFLSHKRRPSGVGGLRLRHGGPFGVHYLGYQPSALDAVRCDGHSDVLIVVQSLADASADDAEHSEEGSAAVTLLRVAQSVGKRAMLVTECEGGTSEGFAVTIVQRRGD